MADALQRLADLFARDGFKPVDPPILQPVAPFLELSGEDVRRRMFLTSDPTGRDYCLRPDFTIPVARAHHEAGGGAGRFSYLGPVFRYRPDQEQQSEFLQAGIEWYGDNDAAMADAQMLTLAIETAALAGITDPLIRIGDVGLVAAFLDALDLPDIWRRRLWRQQGRDADFATCLNAFGDDQHIEQFPALADLLRSGDVENATRVVEDVLSISGVDSVGGRAPRTIAARFVEKARLAAGEGISDKTRDLLVAFEAINGPHDAALDAVANLAGEAGLDIGSALDTCRARGKSLRTAGVDLTKVRFDCRFVRPLDYYTGLIFDLHHPDAPDGGKLIGGGRYDALIALIGNGPSDPAIGFSLWVDRLFGGDAP